MRVLIRPIIAAALIVAPASTQAQTERVQSQWGDTARLLIAQGWRTGVLEFTPGDEVTLVRHHSVTRVRRAAIYDFQVQRGTRGGPRIAPYITGLLGLSLGTLAGALFSAPAEGPDQGRAARIIIAGGAVLGLTGGVKLGLSIARARRPIWVPANLP